MSTPAKGSIRAGVRLTFLGTVASGVLQFLVMTVLARLLTPAEYGAYALCVAIASLSAVFVSNVMERALVVAEADGEPADQSAVLLILSAGISLCALGIAWVLHATGLLALEPALLGATLLANVIGAGAIMPRVLMRRRLYFGIIVSAELAGMLLGAGAMAVALAAAGWGSYALAGGAVFQNIVLVLILRVRHRDAPGWTRPSIARAVVLVRSAFDLGRTAAAEIVNGQVAPLVLATQLGVGPVGLFNRTYSLVQMPIQLLTSSMSRVMVSALFAMRDERARFRHNARVLVQVAGVVVAPVAAGIAGTNETFLLLAFGPRWTDAATFLPLLALSAWAVMMGTLYGIAIEAMRAFAAKTRAQVISTAFLVVLALAGTRLGLIGAVAGIATSGCIYLLLSARTAARVLEMRVAEVLGWLVPGIVVAVPCFAVAWAIGRGEETLATPLRFAVQVAACGVVDALTMLLLFPAVALLLIENAAPVALRLLPWLDRYLRGAGKAVRP
ncbi:oligosaccharide flippase family protein [Sphingomonas sp. R86520]|uniref:oligosaccharide flippase family protein n=1 Tax=Sphingomonas sp. R86520 TaxID=3093859 RepID=UPI0036D23DF3